MSPERDPVVWYYKVKADGDIVGCGSGPRSMIQKQARPGIQIKEYHRRVNDIEEQEVNGRVVRRPQSEIDARMPPAPDPRPQKRTKNITFEMWDELQQRITDLEDQLDP